MKEDLILLKVILLDIYGYVVILSVVILEYFSSPNKKFDKRLILLFIVPTIYAILTLTNDLHGLIGKFKITSDDAYLIKYNFFHLETMK